MTPLEIQIMLHYYYSPNDYNLQPPAVQEAVARFLDKDLLRLGSITLYEITERGMAYVEMLKKVPLPICKWVAP